MSLGYVNQFFDFLNATFVPTGGRLNKLERVTGSTSVVIETCADVRVPKTAAIYIVELAINDLLPQPVCERRLHGNKLCRARALKT